MKKSLRIEITLRSWKTNFKNTKTSPNSNKLAITLLREDLTIQETNAIVNAANANLHLGAGIAGAIRTKGGNKIQEECYEIISDENQNRSLNNGDVAYTGIGNFTNNNLKYIFHAVGPMYFNGKRNEKDELTNCFLNCFKLADKLKLNSIAIPPISTGIFGYPKEEGAQVFFDCVEKYFSEFLKEDEVQEEEKEKMKENITISNEDDGLFYETKYVKDYQTKNKINKTPIKGSLYVDTNNDDRDINRLYRNPNITNSLTQTKTESKYEDINKVTTKTEKKYFDINCNLEDQQEENTDLSFTFGSKILSKNLINEDNPMVLTPDLNESADKKKERETLKDKETKEAYNPMNVINDNTVYNIYEKFDYQNRNKLMKMNMKNEIDLNDDKSNRIIKSTYVKDSKINLKNYTLNDIYMVIIDKLTFEKFYDIFQEKILDWKKNKEYKIE